MSELTDFMVRLRPPEVGMLEDAVVRYFVMRCGVPGEEAASRIRDSLAVYANTTGDGCILAFNGGGEEFPSIIGSGSLPVDDMLTVLGEYMIQGAELAAVASYVNERGITHTPLKWRGWGGFEADRVISFFAAQGWALEMWRRERDAEYFGPTVAGGLSEEERGLLKQAIAGISQRLRGEAQDPQD